MTSDRLDIKELLNVNREYRQAYMAIGFNPLKFYQFFFTALTNKIILKQKGVEVSVGVISKRVELIPYSKIQQVSVKQGLRGRLYNFGDITLTVGNDFPVTIKGIERPMEIKEIIEAQMEKNQK